MKISIIGCGYVGSNAARHWKQKGHFLSAATRSLEKQHSLSAFIDHVVLFHEASTIIEASDVILFSVAADRKEAYEEAYLHTAQMILASLPPTAHLLYTSSTSVYGDHQGEWVTEETFLHPLNPQSEILVKTEALLLQKAPRATIFRLGEIYGPGKDWKMKIQRLEGKKMPGSGEQYINITSLEMIIKALDFAIDHSLLGVFNLVEEIHPSRKEWYTQLCKEYHLPKISWDPSLPPFHGGNKRVLSEKIKRAGLN